MTTLTPWFHVSTPPVRPGWYEYSGLIFDDLLWWDGINWLVIIPSGKRLVLSTLPGDQWRGRTKPAKENT